MAAPGHAYFTVVGWPPGEWPRGGAKVSQPSDKGTPLQLLVRPTPELNPRMRSALSSGQWRNTMIELTLKVKITAAQVASAGRYLLLLLVTIT